MRREGVREKEELKYLLKRFGGNSEHTCRNGDFQKDDAIQERHDMPEVRSRVAATAYLHL